MYPLTITDNIKKECFSKRNPDYNTKQANV